MRIIYPIIERKIAIIAPASTEPLEKAEPTLNNPMVSIIIPTINKIAPIARRIVPKITTPVK